MSFKCVLFTPIFSPQDFFPHLLLISCSLTHSHANSLTNALNHEAALNKGLH